MFVGAARDRVLRVHSGHTVDQASTPEALGGEALAFAQGCYISPRFFGTLRLLPAVRRRLRYGRRPADGLDAEGTEMGMATRPTARI